MTINTYLKPIVILLLVIIVILGLYLYLFRAPSAPSQDINAPVVNSEAKIYEIDPSVSSAEFRVDEILNGKPFTAVGVTNQIAGSFAFNLENPALSQVGVALVNARTLKTDSEKRDGAIARFILKSEDAANEFIEFQPKSISLMPEKITVGEDFTFNVVGDLRIAGITKEQTFSFSGKLVSPTEYVAEAIATVSRADYSLTIPNVPFVASVDDDVLIVVKIRALVRE